MEVLVAGRGEFLSVLFRCPGRAIPPERKLISISRIITIVVVLAGANLCAAQAQEATADLFHAVEWSGGLADEVQGSTVRWRPASIDRVVLETARADLGRPDEAPPPVLRLNLFDDVVLAAAVDHSEPTPSGYSLSGRVGAIGSMTLVVNGDVIAGTVRTTEATYTIRSLDADVVAIRRVDSSTLPPGAEPLLPPRSDSSDSADTVQPITRPAPLGSGAPDPPTRGREADDGSVIDLAVFYTPAARRRLGGHGQIHAEIDLMMAETNRAYSASPSLPRVRASRMKSVTCGGRSARVALQTRANSGRAGGSDDGLADASRVRVDAEGVVEGPLIGFRLGSGAHVQRASVGPAKGGGDALLTVEDAA